MGELFTSSARELVGYILAGIAALFWSLTAMWRRYSKDTVERVKDRDEIDSTRIAREDANRLRNEVRELRSELTEAYRQSNEHMREAGKINARVDMQSELSRMQTETIRTLREELARANVVSLNAINLVGEKADRAYHEANTINKKIEEIGMKMADNKPVK